MTLDRLRPLSRGLLRPFVGAARRLGLSPDAVSALAFLLAVAASGAFYLGPRRGPVLYFVGALLTFCTGWLDLVDGELARETGAGGPRGDLLDHVLDRYADIAIIAGLAAGIGRYDLGLAAITGVLMTSYLGTQAQAVGLDRVYGGAVGRADRLALVVLVGGLSAVIDWTHLGLPAVGWLLVFLAVVGHLTAIQRFYYSFREL